MNVSLTPQLAGFVRDAVSSGMYNNASELMREALRRLKYEIDRQRADLGEDTGETAKRIAQATAEVKRGEFTDYDAPRLRAFGKRVIEEIGKPPIGSRKKPR